MIFISSCGTVFPSEIIFLQSEDFVQFFYNVDLLVSYFLSFYVSEKFIYFILSWKDIFTGFKTLSGGTFFFLSTPQR